MNADKRRFAVSAPGSGSNVLPLEAAGLAVGGTTAVIGLLKIAVRFGHGADFSKQCV
jgi:hypothetical protein